MQTQPAIYYNMHRFMLWYLSEYYTWSTLQRRNNAALTLQI